MTEAISDTSCLEALKQAAINALARREHSRRELRLKLINKLSLDEAHFVLLDGLLDELQHERLLCDTRFAEMTCRHNATKGFGPRHIKRLLEQHEIARELAEALLRSDDYDWFSLAKSVKEKKFGVLPAKDKRDIAKQQRFLSYRGFGHEHIQYALKQD